MIYRCDLEPQYRQYENEILAAIKKVLASGVYVLGKEVAGFEKNFAQYHGVEHCVGVANATDALTLALLAFDVGVGDEVITTPFTAIPTVSAIVDAGAKPVFVDIDPETYLMDLNQVAAKITARTKAIMPVHIFGNVLDIAELKKIVGGRFPIIEDASQAHGATINGQKAGTMADCGVFSFYPTKNLGGYGDGGAIITNQASLAKKLVKKRMYGMVDKDHIDSHGVNSRLDELQAAILNVKLPHLDAMNEKRNQVANRYQKELKPGKFNFQKIAGNVYSNYHVMVARYLGDRDQLMQRLEALKIQTNIYYKVPLHLQVANQYLGYKPGDLPNVEAVCRNAIALPLYPEISKATLDFVIQSINQVC